MIYLLNGEYRPPDNSPPQQSHFYISPFVGTEGRSYALSSGDTTGNTPETSLGETSQKFYGGLVGYEVDGPEWGGGIALGPIKYVNSNFIGHLCLTVQLGFNWNFLIN